MPIVVKGTAEERAKVERWLQQLCPHVRINASNRVELVDSEGDMTEASCCCLKYLISGTAYVVTIYPLSGPGAVIPGTVGKKIGDHGGGAADTDPGATYRYDPDELGRYIAGIGADTDVYFDISDNNGKGYFGYDAQNRPISFPPFLLLGQLLCTGYAYHNARGTAARTRTVRSAQALAHENAIRRGTPAPNGRPYAQRANGFVCRVGMDGITTRPPDNY
ncbi:MAG: hypothetical protein D6690_10910 [Nitrospirae bacterium]|nr:MAG: hypothetical protein D6690_10910 [Nitrospirota bacterium]